MVVLPNWQLGTHMTDLSMPDFIFAGFAMAAAVLYAAWHEYSAKNARDARLLAAMGAAGLMGSTAVWLQ